MIPVRTERKGVEPTVAPQLIQHINIRPHVIKIVAVRRLCVCACVCACVCVCVCVCVSATVICICLPS